MTDISEIISYASGLGSIISAIALVVTIYYYSKQTKAQQEQIEQLEKQTQIQQEQIIDLEKQFSFQECLQVRDSTLGMLEVLTPLILEKIENIDRFRSCINSANESPVNRILFSIGLFDSPIKSPSLRITCYTINYFESNFSQLLIYLESLKRKVPHFENYESRIEDLLNKMCGSYTLTEVNRESCQVLKNISFLQQHYSYKKIPELYDYIYSRMTVFSNYLTDYSISNELKNLFNTNNEKEISDILDKLSFIIHSKCGNSQCSEKFPLKEILEGKINPLKDLLNNTEDFCKRYELNISCMELKPILVILSSVINDNEKSKILYSFIYLNWLFTKVRDIINSIQLPSDRDLKEIMADLIGISCTEDQHSS